MINLGIISKPALIKMINESDDDALVEEIYEELDRREEEERFRDFREQDARAADEDRLDAFRREF